MKGLELSRQFYNQCGKPMLQKDFADIWSQLAVGLAGSGSECFGYDDEISRDHDFEPGFCIFIPSEDTVDRRRAFALERAYASLPKEFMGFKRQPLSPVGGARHGVIRIEDFFLQRTGTPDGRPDIRGWFSLPEQSLAEATNGEIFLDNPGIVTGIRKNLEYLPDSVRQKKLAGNLLVMGQAGQYNYKRCLDRGDTAAAQLTMVEYVQSALRAVFLTEKRYMPYYKWCFRSLRGLKSLGHLHDKLEFLISSGNEQEARLKLDAVEQISRDIIYHVREQGLTNYEGDELEGHAYSVNNNISEEEIRNLHILSAL